MSYLDDGDVEALFRKDNFIPNFNDHIKNFFKDAERTCMNGLPAPRRMDLHAYQDVCDHADDILKEVYELGDMPRHNPSWTVRRALLFKRWIENGKPED